MNTFLMLVQPFAIASVHLKVWDSRDQTLSMGALLKVEDVLSICLKRDLINNENSKGPHTLLS